MCFNIIKFDIQAPMAIDFLDYILQYFPDLRFVSFFE